MALTPLQGDPVPDNVNVSPLVGTHMLTYATVVERRIPQWYDTAAARDAALPVGARLEGQLVYVRDTNMWAAWDGVRWVETGGARQRTWTWTKPSTELGAMDSTYVHTGVGITIPSAPEGEWLLSMSLSLQYTATASGNVRMTATHDGGVTDNLANDPGLDLTGSPSGRVIVAWTAPLTTTSVAPLSVDTFVLASGAGSVRAYQGSRITAAYLGPR